MESPGVPGVGVRVPSSIALQSDGTIVVSAMGTHVLARIDADLPVTIHTTGTVHSPCGIAIRNDDTVLAFSQFDHVVDVRREPRIDSATPRSEAFVLDAIDRVALGTAPIDPRLELGRMLFHEAGDSRISSDGLSCAGCHPDGRDDGLVWFFSEGGRQTPTLSGRLMRPFNWSGTRATLEANIAQTVHRLGGTGLRDEELTALATYLSEGLPVPDRARPRDDPELRGRDLCAGAAGCDGCHIPERNFTDGARHGFVGDRFPEATHRFDTPSLALVEGTAPYFHDGRFATLRDVLVSHRHRMGHADSLASEDVDALEAYLRTL